MWGETCRFQRVEQRKMFRFEVLVLLKCDPAFWKFNLRTFETTAMSRKVGNKIKSEAASNSRCIGGYFTLLRKPKHVWNCQEYPVINIPEKWRQHLIMKVNNVYPNNNRAYCPLAYYLSIESWSFINGDQNWIASGPSDAVRMFKKFIIQWTKRYRYYCIFLKTVNRTPDPQILQKFLYSFPITLIPWHHLTIPTW